MANTISVDIVADVAKMRRGIDEVNGRLSGMAKTGKRLAGALVFGAAAKGVLDFGRAAVTAASDAQQSLGATETVFGKYADTVVKHSQAAASEFGLSANQYRESANLLGSLFKNQGVATDQLAGKTKDMVGLGADLAATFGGTTKDAVEALGSAFKGEFDPLERYGVSVKASTVAAELAARGQDKLTGAAKKQAEQVALTDLIMKQAKDSQGAFGRESNTLAGQQQRLAAKWENIKATVGTALLPVLTRLLTMISDNMVPAFQTLMDWISPAVKWIKDLGSGAGSTSGVFATLSTFIQTRVVPAVQGIIEAFRGYLDVVIPIVKQVADTIIQGWTAIQPQVQAIWSSVKAIITSALEIIRLVVTRVTQVVRAVWNRFGAGILRFITTTMRNVANVIKGVFKIIQGLFKVVSSALRGDWKGLWDGIKKIVSGATDVVKGILKQAWAIIKGAAKVGWAAIRGVIDAAWDKIKEGVRTARDRVVEFMRDLPGKITGALGNLGSLLYSQGVAVITGFISGLRDKAADLAGAVKSYIIDKLPGPVAKALGISSPSRVFRTIGEQTAAGLALGLQRGQSDVERALGGYYRVFDGFSPTVDATLRTGGIRYAGQRAGGIVVNITAPVGSSPADIGRTLDGYLREWQRVGGRA